MVYLDYFQMKQWIKAVLVISLILMEGCRENSENSVADPQPVYKVAFMPDVHFHDLFAQFEPGSFDGLPINYQGKERSAVIRTMEAQLTSTRLFNENYFALLAALESAVDRGIKHIGLPGDFSDDGQPAHVSGLVDILDKYRTEHGVSFFITPGNHDPGRPFTNEAGKRDYLGKGGIQQPVFSRNHPLCSEEYQSSVSAERSHAVACTNQVKELGYEGLFELIGDFGLNPNSNYHYYETPFSGNRMDSEELPDSIFNPENRQYEICHEGSGGTFRQADYTNCFDVMDMSYLAEPVEGLWLLALDTNVYIPHANESNDNPSGRPNFSGSGNAGYNKVVTHKKHLVEWMTDIAKRAEENGKTLISFSHFPATDFYNGAGPIIEKVWGEDEFQMVRLPEKETTNTILNTGIGLHIAGHMHMNGVEIARDSISGQTLTNIQVPSLAAYVPAYKIVRMFEESGNVEIETVTLTDVPDYDTLFPLYEQEWSYLDSVGYSRIWNKEILNSENYHEFTDWHIRELSRLRFLPGEWPDDLRDALSMLSGRELLMYSQMPDNQLGKNLMPSDLDHQEHAARKASEIASLAGFSIKDFDQWDGTDLSVDFYRIRNAGELALRQISPERIEQYSVLADAFGIRAGLKNSENDMQSPELSTESLHSRLASVLEVMALFSNRHPGDHVRIDLKTGDVNNLKESVPRFPRRQSSDTIHR